MSNTVKERAVMAAHDEGKPIQRTARNEILNWWGDAKPSWNWAAYEYRVEPDPLTVWVNVYLAKNGDLTFYSYETEHQANRCRSKGGRTVKMQEVIE